MIRLMLTLVALSCCLTGCKKAPTGAAQRQIRILCGSSMSEPAQELGRIFEEEHAAKVIYDFGGSETLLPRVLVGAEADIFICHDPFEQKVKEGGKWAGSAAVGELRPVLLVRPGNPKGIKSVEDLARMPGLKIGLGNPKDSTCGQMCVEMLDRKGLREQVMSKAELQGRTHQEIAMGLIAGPLDAAVVWNFVARLYEGKVQLVPTDDKYEPIRVTIVGLTQSTNPVLRDAFLELCRTPQAARIFASYGYTAAPGGQGPATKPSAP